MNVHCTAIQHEGQFNKRDVYRRPSAELTCWMCCAKTLEPGHSGSQSIAGFMSLPIDVDWYEPRKEWAHSQWERRKRDFVSPRKYDRANKTWSAGAKMLPPIRRCSMNAAMADGGKVTGIWWTRQWTTARDWRRTADGGWRAGGGVWWRQ